MQIRTIFNLLGPLLNPASAAHLFIGVYHPSLLPMYADAIFRLGVDKALVVHCGGLDELAPIDVAEAMEITRDGVRCLEIDPFALGFDRCVLLRAVWGVRFCAQYYLQYDARFTWGMSAAVRLRILLVATQLTMLSDCAPSLRAETQQSLQQGKP